MTNRAAARMNKLRTSAFLSQKEEKEEQTNAVLNQAEYFNRPKLIPMKQQDKISAIDWPEVHADMGIAELIAARVSLIEALKSLKPEKPPCGLIGLFNDADTACNDVWTATVLLRCLVPSISEMPSCGIGEQGLPYLLKNFAILDMEKAVEKLTCELLNPNNSKIFQRSSPLVGQLKSNAKMVGRYTTEAKSWGQIGDMLIKGINEGNTQFVRGALEALEARSAAIKSHEETAESRSHLISRENFIQRMEGQKGLDTAMEGLGQGAIPIAPIIGKRNRGRTSPHHLATIYLTTPTTPTPKSKGMYNGKTQTKDFPDSSSDELEAGEIREFQPPKRAKYNTDMNSDITVHPPITTNRNNLIPSKRGRRLHLTASGTTNSIAPHGPGHRETEIDEDSLSDTDEEDAAEMHELMEAEKIAMYNLNMPLTSKLVAEPPCQETPRMKKIRMEIEAVRIVSDAGCTNGTKTEPNKNQDGADVATIDEINDQYNHFQQAAGSHDGHSDEGIGSE